MENNDMGIAVDIGGTFIMIGLVKKAAVIDNISIVANIFEFSIFSPSALLGEYFLVAKNYEKF